MPVRLPPGFARLPASPNALPTVAVDSYVRLDEFARGLEGKERVIFEKRLVSDEPATLQEIGDQFGVSRERARQIEARLVARLKEFMRAELPDFDHLTLEPPDE